MKAKVEEKKDAVKFLSKEKSRNINLAVLPKCKAFDTFVDVRKSIMRVDDNLCTETFLGNLISYLPTKDDKLDVMKKYLEGPPEACEELDTPEQFTVEMHRMYRYEQRIQFMLFRVQFWERFDQLEKLLLVIGNYMNAQSLQGGAFGMRISSINKLVDTKASNTSSLNLLHVVTGVVRRQFPHLLEFLVDLKSIDQAARIMASLNDMVQQYTEMRKGLKDLDLELKTRWQPEDVELEEDDKFRDIMTKHYEDASTRFQDLEALYVNMDAKWKDVMTYYGENPKVMRPDDFFATFSRFVASWKEASAAEEKMAQRQEREEKKRREEEERKERMRLKKEKAEAALKEKRGPIEGIDTSGEGENDRCMMDSLLDKLRTGDVEVRTTRRRSRKQREEQDSSETSSVSAADLLKSLESLPCIVAAIAIVKASSIKGIAPENQSLYRPSSDGTWKCLDGSKVILYSAINDDYCDCLDGSDEPGHIPGYIKSYSVNDGVCDEACCDGSDESTGLADCPNRCKEVGEAYRKKQEMLQKAIQQGLAAKQRLVDEAEKQVSLWDEEKSKLEDELIIKKSFVMKLERELNALESENEQRSKLKKKCPSCVQELTTLKHDISTLLNELEILKTILHDMKRDHNHNFHDMAVKSAISGYDEFMTRYARLKEEIEADIKEVESKESQFEDNEIESDSEECDNNQGKNSSVDTVLKKLEAILPDIVKTNVLDKLFPRKEASKDYTGYSHNEGDIDKARKAYEDAQSEVNQLSSDLDKINEELNFDYGKEKEWLKLKDVCIEKNEGEYTYSLCFLGDAYQKSNKDHTRVHLGKFSEFTGDGDDKYKRHSHTQGTRCWNGPERSVKAIIDCGVKNEILEVSEPEKCEYLYRVTSPAVCQEIEQQPKKSIVHEEL
ncbi:hypothetical protein G6F70_009036 [Rhizopus microsporus]|nr:hypothetical protein G6F70_009036 [Rhizopus microsporus]